ncbi:Na-translocating system protein MpsC family protein [Fictibacillus sp. B-59209]|uniref:Na-translocating system protein MpsC family protein n=1 Tax=Fictibacillus sp. B-59209 TaxID=3024873 RepID=UPI002E221DB0|nr:Na-translocating system protein MpsC family protein [Fictibacillus sp. B-59209]
MQSDLSDGEPYEGKEQMHLRVIKMSSLAEKAPTQVTSYKLSHRTLIVVLEGVLVAIEKQLISFGIDETLKVSKLQLEKGLLQQFDDYVSILNADILDIFVDWHFKLDKSVITFILKPKE